MALEMRVYEELSDIDPKVIAGLTWRQLGAVGLMVVLGGGLVGSLRDFVGIITGGCADCCMGVVQANGVAVRGVGRTRNSL